MLRFGVIATIVGAALAGCGGAATIAPPLAPAVVERDTATPRGPESVGPRIAEVLYHGGELWVLHAQGTLLSADLEQRRTRRQLAREHVVDLHRTLDDRLWALAIAPETEDLHVWQRTPDGWKPIIELALGGSAPLGLTDFRGRPLILTERAIFWHDGSTLRSTGLDERVTPGLVAPVHLAATQSGDVYAGVSHGEFGGSLRRIELASGRVQSLRREDDRQICSAPLDPGCDPITGLVPDPDAPACVLASIGLSHFLEHGRLLRVCGSRISVVPGPWSAPDTFDRGHDDASKLARLLAPEDPDDGVLDDICKIDPAACPMIDADADADRTAGRAIFGMARTRRGVWIITRTALYHTGSGSTERVQPPAYEPFGRTAVGRLAGAIAVATDAQWAASLSGFTPLVAATDLARVPGTTPPPPALPFGRCFISAGSRLCIDADRYFWRDERGWTSGAVSWKAPAKNRSVVAHFASGEVRFHFSDGYALATPIDARPARPVRLTAAGETEQRALRREIADLDHWERACDLAQRCASAHERLERARDEGADGEEMEQPEPPPPPRDLGSCLRSMSRALGVLRQESLSDEREREHIDRAIAACSAE